MIKIKTNFKTIFLLLVTFSLVTSCSDVILKENPSTFVDPDALLVDKAGAEIYLVGAYDAIHNLLGSGGSGVEPFAIHWGTIATDEVVVPGWGGAGRKEMYLQQVSPSMGSISSMWRQLYKAVNIANSVVDRVGAMTPDQIETEDKEYIVAQAKWIRAATYFALVNAFENVPLITNETIDLNNLEVSQASPAEVYDFIVQNLIEAEAHLPSEQGGGRVTKGAANALLGKVYLQMTGFPLNQTDKFSLAEKALNKVITSGVYDLLPNYAEVFDLEHEQSVEMIISFSMEGPGLSEGGNLSTFYGPNGSVNEGGGWGTCYINHEFRKDYETDDLRLRNNIAVHNANDVSPEEAVEIDPSTWPATEGAWRAWKWHAEKPNSYANDTPFDNPYIRYADVLLLYAEALNGQGKLTQSVLDMTVNRLRGRARAVDGAVADMVLGSQQENADELLAERRRELCFEGWRRFDLVRYGKYKETILNINEAGWWNAGNPGVNYEDHEIRWPIPDSEMQLNPNLVQNPGY
ncbi:RagB/SusD family nutrient uptake outer membrane protein [Polaribacter reichenbachii]|uniref:Carbohydrate-binding protein SusD n=1 Tax=Polaribacter reichenbachii TaxID=996801 RepID=A0A1B8TUX9_9FLAO|nr:RagB/SusD family nutrient uptake outer membrane protein [Polaribacter reichenbachii]APZ45493.1 RagB/SusD family nutrient uptake outer membrane protein [Polaribacter reichenbachii]AUC19354.1 RagB/SusD family nutrient uptake outer membrane protein [Polaribacter reichenbachii]OBY63491.1 carbohydrate-binding protein SusD [Polaribacter reichenbachii]